MVDELAKLEIVPSAMIDISDGLASEALHIAAQSGCGVKLYEDKIAALEQELRSKSSQDGDMEVDGSAVEAPAAGAAERRRPRAATGLQLS